MFLQFHDRKAHINYIDVVAGSQIVTDSGRQWQVAAGIRVEVVSDCGRWKHWQVLAGGGSGRQWQAVAGSGR